MIKEQGNLNNEDKNKNEKDISNGEFISKIDNIDELLNDIKIDIDNKK